MDVQLPYLRDLLVYEMACHLVDLRNAAIQASGRMEGLLGYEGAPGLRRQGVDPQSRLGDLWERTAAQI